MGTTIFKAALWAALFSLTLLPFNVRSQQWYVNQLLVLNGGIFNDFTEDANLLSYKPDDGSYSVLDTIHSQSAQDVVIDSTYAFVAAQDSLVKYDLNTGERLAAVRFNGTSTYMLELYKDYLLVGNWYGQSNSNLYVYNKSDLSFAYVVPDITKGIRGMAIYDDVLFVSQNYTSSTFADSAGYLSLVNLTTQQHISDLTLDTSSKGAGNLFVYDDEIYCLRGSDGSYSTINPSNLAVSPLQDFSRSISGGYGSLLQLRGDTLFGVFDGRLASYNLSTQSFVDTLIADTNVTAFVYDTVNHLFYITQTDYFSYRRGLVYNQAGALADTFAVGHSPESLALDYRMEPVGVRTEVRLLKCTVYPNPASEYLVIQGAGEMSKAELSVIAMNGQVVLSKAIRHRNDLHLNITSLPHGAYLLYLADGKTRYSAPFIKE